MSFYTSNFFDYSALEAGFKVALFVPASDPSTITPNGDRDCFP